jgi:phenylalanine-4-hydroxylase
LKGLDAGADRLTDLDLQARGFTGGRRGRLEFASGVAVEGTLQNRLERDGRMMLLSFGDCSVSRGGETFHRPGDGPFDLACGRTVRSVFGGAADRYAHLVASGEARYEPGIHKTNLVEGNRTLNDLYARLRRVRDEGRVRERPAELDAIASELERAHPHDWLLRWELLELDREHALEARWSRGVREQLLRIRGDGAGVAESIDRGLALLA